MMSQIKMDSEDIAKIRNALTIVQLSIVSTEKLTIDAIKRIDRLLPQIKFEGGK